MALERGSRPFTRYIRCTRHDRTLNHLPIRSLATTTDPTDPNSNTPPQPPSDSPPQTSSQAKDPKYSGRNPNKVHTPRSERDLLRTKNLHPIGTRRRRAALATSTNIPFSQLPYQCFQEARKILAQDREEKVVEIQRTRDKMARLQESIGQEKDEVTKVRKEHIMRSHGKRLEDLKTFADINDPVVKRRFEDGMGDMTKPIYRHLSHLQWSSMKRKVLMQRITQMNVTPDVLPHIDPSVSTVLTFRNKKIPHGEFVLSALSEAPPSLDIQAYDKGERLVTVAVVNADVPNVEKDGFDTRCHFLASNIPISPTQTSVEISTLDLETQVILPWLPPYTQKGAPYQRLCIFILEQHPPDTSSTDTPHGELDITQVKEKGRYTVRENFSLRSFLDKHGYKPVGVDLFRSQWDEGTAGVMERAGIVGADVEFRRKRVEPLPYKRLKEERFR